MNIKPRREQFLKLREGCQYIPVVGEERAPALDPARLYKSWFEDKPDSFLFESGKGENPTARFSIMGASNGQRALVKCPHKEPSGNGSSGPDNALQQTLDRLSQDQTGQAFDYVPHFWGGWVGYLAYETGRVFEDLPLKNVGEPDLPDVYFVQADRVVVYDHENEILKYIIAASTEKENGYQVCLDEINAFWTWFHDEFTNQLEGDEVEKLYCADSSNGSSLKSNLTQSEYVKIVNRAKTYIAEGDIYQANLAQRFVGDYTGEPFDLFLKLRALNPSPFSGYLKFDDFAIVSSSPERLFRVDGSDLETRPIAGTRPRGATPEADQRLSAELFLSAKEKAEHLMLVDLERNDMGRVCRFGTVEVTEFMALEQYSHVSHIVSNVRGQLKPQTAPTDIIKALFPGGTITGCPKIRCMEIIDELEPHRRGPYSGSFGYIGFGPYMDFNIVIRTILVKNGKAYFHVGAGIVADSIPEKEYQETLDKAAAMMHVLVSRD